MPYLENQQPYNQNSPALRVFTLVHNDNKHDDLRPQTRVEETVTTVSSTVHGGQVSWTGGVQFSAGVSIMGVPVDPTTQLPVPQPDMIARREVWVDFLYEVEGQSHSVLQLLSTMLNNVKTIVAEVRQVLTARTTPDGVLLNGMADESRLSADSGHRTTWRRLARACTLLLLATRILLVDGQGTLAYRAVVPNAGDLTDFLVNKISSASFKPSARTAEIIALSANHAKYKADPNSENLHPVRQMAARRKQQCADLLNGQRKLGSASTVPQEAIDCVCDKQGENIPYYVCNARYHQAAIPLLDQTTSATGQSAGLVIVDLFRILPFGLRELYLNYFNITDTGKTTPDSVAAGRFDPTSLSSGQNAATTTNLGNILKGNFAGNGSLPADMTAMLGGFTMDHLRASLNSNQSNTLVMISNKVRMDLPQRPAQAHHHFVMIYWPAFVKVALSVNLPGVNLAPVTSSNRFSLEVCETNGGGCTTYCPPGPGGNCNGRAIESKIVEAVAQSNVNLDIAVCVGYTGSDPASKDLYMAASALLRLLGLDPCPIHGGVTIFPFVLIADGYVSIGIAFFDIKADVEVKFSPDNGFSKQICDFLQEGCAGDNPTPAFEIVKCRPWCRPWCLSNYQKAGDGIFTVAFELHVLWFSWSFTLFTTSFGSDSEPILCKYPPVGVYGPPNGRNDTYYNTGVIPDGNELISANGNFLLRISKGAVALFDSQQAGTFPDVRPTDTAVWSYGNAGVATAFKLTEDGDFQNLYPTGDVFISLGTSGYVLGKPYMTVTNDGRVVLRDTYKDKCYWDSAGHCKDSIKYWPAGFPDSLVESGNGTDPNYKPTCISNQTMLVSKNRIWALAGNKFTWSALGQGRVQTRPNGDNSKYSYRRAAACKLYDGFFGDFCISSRKGDYPAYVLSNQGQSPEVVWSISDTKNAADLEGPLHMTMGDDGVFGMWDYNGKQIFSYGPNDGNTAPGFYGQLGKAAAQGRQ
ncbi:hypothetical protein WJX72_003640 [[Myrmecia] bisecta]|uniref:Uncharacterized protein n=1 Tax=[Myrmecia] bisecta TaxID=41462 RepID=A0AAW1R6W4_9CHLO